MSYEQEFPPYGHRGETPDAPSQAEYEGYDNDPLMDALMDALRTARAETARLLGERTNLEAALAQVEERAAELGRAGARLHDALDDLNANTPDGAVCWFCRETGYDGNGLIHMPDCVLVEWRALTHIEGSDG